MTVKIGITGGIGSGKSVVSRLLEVMGIPVYISDGETKQLMMTDSCIRSELTALLGEEAFGRSLYSFRSFPSRKRQADSLSSNSFSVIQSLRIY